MKTSLVIPLILIAILVSNCNNKAGSENILIGDFNTLHETVPFDDIKVDDYMPAIESAIETAKLEIEKIANNREEPDFVNTIEPLDTSGIQVSRISLILGNMISANTSDTMQQLAQKIFPMITEFSNDIYLNEKLFERVKSVYHKKDQYVLNSEQSILLDKTYKDFIRRGANLNKEEKEEYRGITVELSRLTLTFGDNVLNETNAYQLHITNEQDLAGLPERVVEAASQTARSKDLEGWVFTLQYPSILPFIQYAENRELREEMYKALSSIAFHGNDKDNSEIIRRIVDLRLQLANILGYKTYADYVLEIRMAENSQRVNEFLDELLATSMPFAREDNSELQQFAKSQGADFQLMEWDWGFYSTKLLKDWYNFDDEMTRPYFELDNVQSGIFELANTLYGISFKENKKIKVYHSDVKAYEVFDADGSFLAVLYLDFFPRENKRSGAWSSNYREQCKINSKNIRPHVTIVCNFTEPTETKPSLLTIPEVNTFLHEFGHALHGIFSDCTYLGTGSFEVYWDFIELPSQIMENWAQQKEWLAKIATHYETGESIPDTLVDNYINSINFQSGNAFRRQIAFSLLDMAWHSITAPIDASVQEFENNAMASAELLPPVEGCLISTSFNHIFAGGYAVGYYSYKWAEVLDADAFSLFKENGIFDKATAQSFRENILSKGATEHPLELYRQFRGREPNIDALLERSGLVVVDSP